MHLIGLKNLPPNYGNSSEVEHFQTNDIGSLYTRAQLFEGRLVLTQG